MEHVDEDKQGGCCGGEKKPSHTKQLKEKDDCCDSGNEKKLQTDQKQMPKTKGSCCG
jgi:hypothetical protein